MALGTTTSVFNDEACVLLHNKKKRNYMTVIGEADAKEEKPESSIIMP